MTSFDASSKYSILNHARLMLGQSLNDRYNHIVCKQPQRQGKGGLGQAMEEIHFKYHPNSEAKPDFEQAGVELKCTPLKILANGSMVSKERLVLNIINYIEEADKTFHTSSFWMKNNCLLLMFYLHEADKNMYDYVFKLIRYWEFPDTDLKIIMDDWQKIHEKILSGRAHEISEGDTFYLGACPKGSKKNAEMRPQPYSSTPAPQRAYSLKSRYINTIILDSVNHPDAYDGVELSPSQRAKIHRQIAQADNIVKSLADYHPAETFEQLIERRFKPYYGKTITEIEAQLGCKVSDSPKAISYTLCRAILGVKSPKIAEFEKANIQLKSIRLQHNGTLKEAMVFDSIKYVELMEEPDWESSKLFETLTQRFLFVVFRKSSDNIDNEAVLEKIFFWTMPVSDLEIAKSVWDDTRAKIDNGDYDNFIKQSDKLICHLRPKARNSSDLILTPQGVMKPKKAFWLNRSYVLDIVNSNISR